MRERDRQAPYRPGGPRKSNVDFKAVAAQLAEEEEMALQAAAWQTRLEHEVEPTPVDDNDRLIMSDIPLVPPTPLQELGTAVLKMRVGVLSVLGAFLIGMLLSRSWSHRHPH